MAATVLIRRWTGTTASPVKTDITSINTRDNAFDTHSTADTTNPVQKPTTGLKFGYWVSTRLDATVTPAGTIDNLRWFTDGSNTFGTGITCKGESATSYKQATGTPGDTGNKLTTTNVPLSASPTDVFAFNSGSPNAITGSISNPSTGDFGDFMVYQLEVSTSAGPGASTQETFTWRFDET